MLAIDAHGHHVQHLGFAVQQDQAHARGPRRLHRGLDGLFDALLWRLRSHEGRAGLQEALQPFLVTPRHVPKIVVPDDDRCRRHKRDERFEQLVADRHLGELVVGDQHADGALPHAQRDDNGGPAEVKGGDQGLRQQRSPALSSRTGLPSASTWPNSPLCVRGTVSDRILRPTGVSTRAPASSSRMYARRSSR